ncbi:MAG: UvrD-helicase domain-containing protein [Candidatus Omnitrophota bacterium]
MDNRNHTPSKPDDLLAFPHILKLEASAGSGKTYALARRYLELVINPSLNLKDIPLNNILAITFTNKAALEMKERILEFLKKTALDNFSDERSRQKAFLVMDYLIRNYNYFQVQTIDSFINAILSGCAFKLGLSASFKVRTDSKGYLSYSLDELIERSASCKEVRQIFHNFLRQYLYIDNRLGWFPKKDILLIIQGLFSQSNKYGLNLSSSQIKPEDLIVKKKYILKLLKELEINLPLETNANFSNSLRSFLDDYRESFDLDHLSSFFSRPGFPLKKNIAVPDEIVLLWKSIITNIGQLCEMESLCVFNSYIEIFNLTLDDLKAISSREDILFLESMNKEANFLFSEKALSPPELYYRLAMRLRHFLLDEFQDTSILQWKNLYPMIEEALSTGGSLFYVGDKKQAIYRFRGGQASLVDSVKEEFRQFKIFETSLTKNYRSQKEIVEFNNNIFSEDNLGKFLLQREEASKSSVKFSPQDKLDIIAVFRGSHQEYTLDKSGGYIKVDYIAAENKIARETEIREKISGLLQGLIRKFDYQDIAILARENVEVKLLSEWVLSLGIPVESEKTLNVRENRYIKELVSFLKFLNSPIDDLSFASFILGDIFASASNIPAEKIQEFFFKVRQKKCPERGYLYRDFRREFLRTWEDLIEVFFKNVGFVPLYELTTSIIDKFKILECFPEYQGFFMHLLELIKKQEDEEFGISGFLEHFEDLPEEDLYVNISGTGSVKILTIHKAKGLEFAAVVIPFLEINVQVDNDIAYPDEGSLSLIRLKKRYASFSPGLEKAYRQEYKKALTDELSNIYVALTRAIEELYIFVPKKSHRGANPAVLLLADVGLETGEKTRDNPRKKLKPLALHPILPIPISGYKDWISLLKDEFAGLELLQARDKARKGEILHYILSFVGNLSGENKETVITAAVEKARFKFPFLSDLESYKEPVRRLLEEKKFERFFNSPESLILPEKEIVDRLGNTKRVDRLLISKNQAVIIDYKSASEEDAVDDHQSQVKEYMKIIGDIYPKLKVTGYLIYLDELRLEEVVL